MEIEFLVILKWFAILVGVVLLCIAGYFAMVGLGFLLMLRDMFRGTTVERSILKTFKRD